jgi:Flp pilus assembly protein TadD
LFQEENYAAAIADFAKAAEIDPTFGKAYYALGLSYIKSKQNDKACLSFQQAQKLNYPGASDAVKNLCN